MKRIFTCITCFAYLLILSLFAQEITVLDFNDRFEPNTSGQESVIRLVPHKTKRLDSSLGSLIKAIYAPDLNDEMIFCIKAATELWAEKLVLKVPILLSFKKQSMGAGSPDVITDTRYITSSVSANTIYPNSYALNIGESDRKNDETYPDAEIIINEDVDWDFGFTDVIDVNKKSFTTAMLRSIAISLGFTSSVRHNPAKGITFKTRGCFSPFDNAIVNSNNVYLNTMPNTGRGNELLTSYITGDNVYLKYPNTSEYKLYAPSTYEDHHSLVLFENKGSLMSQNILSGDKILEIDERTLEGIRMIGWQTQSTDIRIVGKDIPATGIVSSYNSYEFHIDNPGGSPISNYSWKYELLDIEKKYITIKTGNSSTFSIDPVSHETLYDKNFEGDIQGRITFEANVGGKLIKRYLSLYLEAKPEFVAVNVNSITPDEAGDFYTLDVTVIYRGVDYLYYELEQEFSSNLWTEFIREPYIANIHFNGIYMRGMAWLDIKLVNNYGSVKKTIEIPRQDQANKYFHIPDENITQKPSYEKPDVDCYEVINLQGQPVLQTKKYSEVTSLPKGIYILKTIKNNGLEEITKIYIK